MTIVGPDDPLVAGVVDAFEGRRTSCLRPKKANAAILRRFEGIFQGPDEEVLESHLQPMRHLIMQMRHLHIWRTAKMPIVLKADGLALGKGVSDLQHS